MLYTRAYPTGSPVTGSSSASIQRSHRYPERAAVHDTIGACRANIAKSRQQCSDAHGLLGTATERLVCSRHFLAISRETPGQGSGEHPPLPQG